MRVSVIQKVRVSAKVGKMVRVIVPRMNRLYR